MRTQQLNAPPSRSRAVLPQSSPPRIVRFVARDDDNADETLGAGDALEIGFDRAARPPAQLCTGRAAAAASDGCADSGDRDFVDALFEFSEPLGAAYRGSWRNAFTFEIIISDASNASLRLGAEVTTYHWAVPGSATSQAANPSPSHNSNPSPSPDPDPNPNPNPDPNPNPNVAGRGARRHG